jgi:hypothetical protein
LVAAGDLFYEFWKKVPHMQTQSFDLRRTAGAILVAAFSLTILLFMVAWGGSARTGPTLALGIAALLGVAALFGVAGWWLYLSPLLGGKSVPIAPPTAQHKVITRLVLASGLFFTVGGLWDEVWHRRYGVGAVIDDFLWPPHILLYSSIALVAVCAAVGLAVAFRGEGGLRERFRADPLLGMLGLVAAYQVVSLPSDAIWHKIYGLDITAWSLPHIIITVSISLVLLMTATAILGGVPRREWRTLRGLSLDEFLALVGIAWAMVVLLQVGTTEWDGLTAIGSRASEGVYRDAFWARPEWLYPVVIVAIALFLGMFALRAVRRAGAATVVGLIVLGFRLITLALLHGETVKMGAIPHLTALPALAALDLWHARRLTKASETGTLIWGSLIAGAAFLLFALPAISAWAIYPRVNVSTLPGMIFFGLVMALAAGWAGGRLGERFGAIHRSENPVTGKISPLVAWLSVGGLALAAAFVVVFILTARPPSV